MKNDLEGQIHPTHQTIPEPNLQQQLTILEMKDLLRANRQLFFRTALELFSQKVVEMIHHSRIITPDNDKRTVPLDLMEDMFVGEVSTAIRAVLYGYMLSDLKESFTDGFPEVAFQASCFTREDYPAVIKHGDAEGYIPKKFLEIYLGDRLTIQRVIVELWKGETVAHDASANTPKFVFRPALFDCHKPTSPNYAGLFDISLPPLQIPPEYLNDVDFIEDVLISLHSVKLDLPWATLARRVADRLGLKDIEVFRNNYYTLVRDKSHDH